jgi:hypothetical protein
MLFVLAILWTASDAAHADGPAAVMAIAGLFYAIAEVIRKLSDQ